MEYLKAEIEKPLAFVSCGHFVTESPGWIHAERTIDSYEIIIGLGGRAYLEQDGARYDVAAGDALLFIPGRTHRGYRVSEEGLSFFWMHFRCRGESEMIGEKAAEALLQPFRAGPYFSRLSGSVLFPVFHKPQSLERLVVLFRQLLHSQEAGYYSPAVGDCLMTILAAELTQQTVDRFRACAQGGEGSAAVGTILEWIRIHADREIRVRELAKRFGFNKDYFTRFFRRHTGTTVVKYVNFLRISRAKELLCGSGLGVKEIAYRVGFRDEKYFMKLFRQAEKLTPSEYRNAYYLTHLNNR